MNKKELAAALAEKTGITKSKAYEVINAIFDSSLGKGIIATELDAGRKVALLGFGTFSTRRRAAHTGKNPGNGADVAVEAKNLVKFVQGKTIADVLLG